ncbi:MAG: ABC transporter permease [Aestuariivirga sp.]|uniref:ABC transporter permease n=1 Tax=Aestuariivirga sp. TaxID=2650926 RepID=UPI0038D2231A
MAAGRPQLNIAALVAPAYLWLAFTVLLPLAVMLFFSFLTAVPVGGREAELTLKHYASFFTKKIYWYNALRSLELAFYVTAACVVLGYPVAMVLTRMIAGRAREAIFLLIILPFWSNALVRTFSWTMVLRGPFDIIFTYPAIVIGLIHAYLPYAVLTIYVSLQAIDERVIEAARSLGASRLQAFMRVMLPLSLPGVLAGVFLIFVPVTGSFMEPRILGGKDAIMLGPIIESQFTATFNWPLGAALSFMMLAIILLILAASYPFLRPRLAR